MQSKLERPNLEGLYYSETELREIKFKFEAWLWRLNTERKNIEDIKWVNPLHFKNIFTKVHLQNTHAESMYQKKEVKGTKVA